MDHLLINYWIRRIKGVKEPRVQACLLARLGAEQRASAKRAGRDSNARLKRHGNDSESRLS
jgi:hypothetical protein